ncbi:MATE family efflux transporter [Lachnospiraceae bacterium]|uniref:MATE family efflux transporter n=1 Tax=Extibacter sp. GGCC_0201 TaxID=2731209 RepID=UPI001AA1089D|nr:MATE family efflux transporter [Extibacter sp. GGCC_0201]MBO1720950.1 MATE family efflux transporter [Extibacter sp. GGCC_0201]BDF31990.1 MATE family efflux transporter [Lachnospiraceae bacterium]BDF36003.1 MATE family efflux transporter [Lachnospiraceae bacterium]
MDSRHDFGQGSVAGNIMRLAIPMTLAQLINVLYNVVDRIYIGHIPHASTQALTGIGLTLPVITIITAFANLFGMGGAPLFSMARGRGDTERARKIMANSFSMLIISGLLLAILCYLFKRPLLYLFGASDATFPYADAYLTLYLCGTLFVMTSLGMNNFINAQGFGIIGMLTVSIGAVLNLILDPIFIFVFHMGVRGAASATVLSQFVSAVWVFRFLTGPKAILRIAGTYMRPEAALVKEITGLGLSGFVMAVTNGSVQIMCNATLQRYGGDLYVGIMTVINSVREIVTMPVNGLTSGAQPVMSFNYGAEKYDRVRSAIRFSTIWAILFSTAAWATIFFFPNFFLHLFSSETSLMKEGVPAMRIYFFGIFMMALQFAGQSVFVALGKSRQAVFFSLFRKVVIVIPLTLWLPAICGLGTDGVFLAEPVSNFIGGTACFVTMMLTVWPALRRRPE